MPRRRSSSAVSLNDNTTSTSSLTQQGIISTQDLETAQGLLYSLLYLRDASGQSLWHGFSSSSSSLKDDKHAPSHKLVWMKSLLDRCRSLDEINTNNHNHNNTTTTVWQRRILLQTESTSGYTALHQAIIQGHLAMILLLLRHSQLSSQGPQAQGEVMDRFTQRPMTLLHKADVTNPHQYHRSGSSGSENKARTTSVDEKKSTTSSSSSSWLWQAMAQAKCHEGLTPLQLLGRLQCSELRHCREAIQGGGGMVQSPRQPPQQRRRRRRRRPATPIQDNPLHDNDDDDNDELNVLRRHLPMLNESDDDDDDGTTDEEENDDNDASTTTTTTSTQREAHYACQVVTFGRPSHCALGVIPSHNNSSTSRHCREDCHSSTPRQVTTFAPTTTSTTPPLAATAIAAATHHTLIVLQNGNLYACGYPGTCGRLGITTTSTNNNNDKTTTTTSSTSACPIPRRVGGPLIRRHVVGVAAAENHSLCVTRDGTVFAWGSNRFGQLVGYEYSSSSTTSTSTSSSHKKESSSCSSSLPRRVEDLRGIICHAVAAGEKHSVALAESGQVYVWGDNTAGQLGVARRSGIQKVQCVESLWGIKRRSLHGTTTTTAATLHPKTAPKRVMAIAAAEQSTMVLTRPTPGAMSQVNAVYTWGHGNHVPIRANFVVEPRESSPTTRRLVNPVAIACAKHHNAAITADGHVYTWGLHADSLGRAKKKHNAQHNHNNKTTLTTTTNSHNNRILTSSPQLVTAMLPEHGGGLVVAVSASEQHTAVVTDSGALYTWGATHGNNVLGHEGVRWQPSPKRVPGVHRAVNVAVAKEHTVLLIGTSFPSIPKLPEDHSSLSLELLAAQKVAEHVNLFNVIPILIMAERTECSYLSDYCHRFVRKNLDGVLNVGRKSEMDQYLNDMLADDLHHVGRRRYRDDRHHPFIFDVIGAGNKGKPSFGRTTSWQSSTADWVRACVQLAQLPHVPRIIAETAAKEAEEDFYKYQNRRNRRLSSCVSEGGGESSLSSLSKPRHGSVSRVSDVGMGELDSFIHKTATMDLSTLAKAQENSTWLTKEIRNLNKKLNQITKLETSHTRGVLLSPEEHIKIGRRGVLENELGVLDNAVKEVTNRLKELTVSEGMKVKKSLEPSNETDDELTENQATASFSCDICGIKCPDATSYELHKTGRKHRNRLAQVAEEEERKAAKSLIQQSQLDQVKRPATSSTVRPTAKATKNVWGVSSQQPKYKLPPPPHPVAPPVGSPRAAGNRGSPASSKTTSPAMVDIFREQKAFAKSPSSTKATKSLKTSSPSSPHWGSKPGGGTIMTATPTKHINAAESSPLLSSSRKQQQRGSSYSLADFLGPKPAARRTPKKVGTSPVSASNHPWGKTPAPSTQAPRDTHKLAAASTASTPSSASSKKKSLAEIQADELSFLEKQDQAYAQSGSGTWFIERRERASSLLEIQTLAQQEHDFVEEQRRIEAQIQREIEQQAQSAKPSSGSSGKNPTGRPKSGRSNKNKGRQRNAPPETSPSRNKVEVTGSSHTTTTSQGPDKGPKKNPRKHRRHNKSKKAGNQPKAPVKSTVT